LGGPPRRGVVGQPASSNAVATTTIAVKILGANDLCRAFLDVIRRIAFTGGGGDARWRSIVAANLGRLAVISTPIGNLGDLSPRARDELAAAELIAAEDTRRTGQLLTTLGLSRPLVSLHEHNETERIGELLEKLRGGARIALVSDAGTPLLSDPGFELVRRAAQEGVSVVAVPGPSAITAALSIAGLPTERFSFEGFLPARLAERRARLAELAVESRTLVFFEAPHRIMECLEDMGAAFGVTRRAAVARELTKVFETVYRGTFGELSALARRLRARTRTCARAGRKVARVAH
jgi:16S rRNA (cytidine1402-2'-O)-methyltransferase